MRHLLGLALAAATVLSAATDAAEVRRSLEAIYPKMFEGLRSAKTMADLDAQSREFETSDWVSVMPGQKPRTWEQLRAFGFEALTSGPKDGMKFEVVKFTMPDENTAVLEGTMRISDSKVEITAPIRDTWIRTEAGWRRKIHEKLAPNKVVAK